MSDDEADPELLELLRQSLGIKKQTPGEVSSDTGVLKDAQFIYNNAIDVSIDMYGTKGAAAEIYQQMQQKSYSTATWSEHELHPKPSEGFMEVDILNFVFTMDLLNFMFWSDLSQDQRFQVEYLGKRWTGYSSLVASLRRALDEGIPITTPRYWRSRLCTDDVLKHVFRSATAEEIPLFQDRISILRQASDSLRENFPDDEDEDDISDVIDVQEAERSGFQTSAAEQMDNDNTPNIQDSVTEPSALKGSNRQVDGLSTGLNVSAGASNDAGPIAEAVYDAAHKSTMDIPEIGSGLPDIPLDRLSLAVEPPGAKVEDKLASNADDLPEIETESGIASDSAPQQTGESPVNTEVESDGNKKHNPHLADTVPVTHSITEQHLETSQAIVKPDHAVIRLIQDANHSAGKLVNLLVKHFECFRDETRFDRKNVRILKRAQIFVADLWAALNGVGLGEFHDIDHLTMFADYRVPQCLHSLGVLIYSPPLDYHIRSLKRLEAGHTWEVQLRGCSIWAVELIRREIGRTHPEARNMNAVLIDFFLYDLAKAREAQAIPSIPHHRTQTIWY